MNARLSLVQNLFTGIQNLGDEAARHQIGCTLSQLSHLVAQQSAFHPTSAVSWEKLHFLGLRSTSMTWSEPNKLPDFVAELLFGLPPAACLARQHSLLILCGLVLFWPCLHMFPHLSMIATSEKHARRNRHHRCAFLLSPYEYKSPNTIAQVVN